MNEVDYNVKYPKPLVHFSPIISKKVQYTYTKPKINKFIEFFFLGRRPQTIYNYVNLYLVTFDKIIIFMLFFSIVIVQVTSIFKRIVYFVRGF